MVKATLRGAVLLGLLAWSVPSFAEVQNVKVGGDVTVRAFDRRNLDLNNGNGTLDHEDRFLMSTTGLNIGADLTENVSTFVRLTNERDWNQDGASTGDFDLSQAYITLKELFYSPLTLRVGAQPIVWGRGFVLGSNLLPSVLRSPTGGGDRNAAITANEYTDFTAFDAIRATLDLSGVAGIGVPLTADYVYVKLDENTIGVNDDVNLQGVNLGTHFDAWNSEAEAYYLNKRDKSQNGLNFNNPGSVSTFGLRGSIHPVEGAHLWGEAAIQFGQSAVSLSDGSRTPTSTGQAVSLTVPGSSAQALAMNFGGEYTFTDVQTTPKIGGEWVFYSGHDKDGAFQGWDPMAPSYFTTLIRSFQTRSTVTGLYPVTQTGVSAGFTNQHEFAIFGGLKPIQDLNVSTRLSWFTLDVGAIPPTVNGSSAKRETFLGTEWDTKVVYDYTDDVQFGFAYGLFAPGAVFRDGGDNGTGAAACTACFGDDTAQELISTVSVKF